MLRYFVKNQLQKYFLFVIMDTTEEPKYEGIHSKITNTFSELLTTIGNFKQQITHLQKQIRTLEKTTEKQFRTMEKEIKKNKPKGKRKPSGFARPAKISDELCEFLNKPPGTELARTEVTQHLISYIKTHNLQKSENRKHIIPDNKLLMLLGLGEQDELTFFNIQGYMNKHFQK